MADKKVRIGSEVDASGAKKGFQEIKAGAESMAQQVKQAGQEAGQGLDNGVSNGAENANRKINKANAALNQSIRRQIGNLQRQLAEQSSGAARGTRAYFEEYAKLRGADIEKVEKNLQQLEAMESRVSRAMQASTNDTRQASFAASNLAAQFQDIAVSAQGGLSPLTIALQQGTQISAAFGSAGAAGGLAVFKSALASVISPMSLMIIAGTAGVSVLIQWVSALFDAGKETKTLDDHVSDFNATMDSLQENTIGSEKSMEDLRKKYGQVTKELRSYINAIQDYNRTQLKTQLEEIIVGTLDEFEGRLSTLWRNVDFSKGFNISPVQRVQEEFKVTREEATKLSQALVNLARSEGGGLEQQIPAVRELFKVLQSFDMSKQTKSMQQLYSEMANLLLKSAEYKNKIDESIKPSKETSDAEKKYRELMDSVNETIKTNTVLATQLENSDRAIGKSAYQTAIFRREIELMTAAKKAGIPVTQELRAVYARMAKDEEDSAQRIKKAQEALDKDPKLKFFEAVDKGAEEWAKKYEDAGKQVQGAVTNAFDAATDTITQFVMTGEASIKKFAETVIAEFVRIAVRSQIIQPIATSIFGAAGASGGSGGTTASARGNAFVGGNVQAFANGGVFTSPITFPMAGNRTGLMAEAGPEAIMPLSRDSQGRLGVRSEGGQGVNIQFELINQSSQSLTSTSQQAFYDEDMRSFVVRAVIEDYNDGGPTRNLIGER